MRFGRGAGTWADKTNLALRLINDCGTKFGYDAFLEHGVYNVVLLNLEIIYLVG